MRPIDSASLWEVPVEREEDDTNNQVEGQNRGILGEIRDVENKYGKGRTQGLDKMDTATNSQSQNWKGKLETWIGGLGEGYLGVIVDVG